MLMRKSSIIFLAALAVLWLLILAPSSAQAYCVYNHTNTDLFVCGESCTHCFQGTIKKGEKRCCPGGDKGCRGHTYITISPLYGGTSCNGFYVPKQVSAHGWVSLFGSCRKEWKKCNESDACAGITAKVHDKDGKVVYDGGVREFPNEGCME